MAIAMLVQILNQSNQQIAVLWLCSDDQWGGGSTVPMIVPVDDNASFSDPWSHRPQVQPQPLAASALLFRARASQSNNPPPADAVMPLTRLTPRSACYRNILHNGGHIGC